MKRSEKRRTRTRTKRTFGRKSKSGKEFLYHKSVNSILV
jgi:hypothetical protein